MWGMLSVSGTGPLIPVLGTVNADVYTLLVIDHAVPACRQRLGIFQQDNAASHAAKTVAAVFDKGAILVLRWPLQSPDLSPIDNLWATIAAEVEGCLYANEAELFATLEAKWCAITSDTCRKLIESCTARCEAVLEEKG